MNNGKIPEPKTSQPNAKIQQNKENKNPITPKRIPRDPRNLWVYLCTQTQLPPKTKQKSQ